MITFNVVKEPFGWAVKMGKSMTTPFRSRELAIQEANCLANAIRGHGEQIEVFIEDIAFTSGLGGSVEALTATLAALPQRG